jgi:uncharacterized delta-60 repeat protein
VLDSSFSTDGKLTTEIGASNDYGCAMVVDSQDPVIVAGYSNSGSDGDVAVVRYTPAGVLDTSFGTGGKVTTPVGSDEHYGYAVAVDSDGRVIVAGWSENGSDGDFAVARYLAASVPSAPSGWLGCRVMARWRSLGVRLRVMVVLW